MKVTYEVGPETALQYLHEIREYYDVTVDTEKIAIHPRQGTDLSARYDRDMQRLTITMECGEDDPGGTRLP